MANVLIFGIKALKWLKMSKTVDNSGDMGITDCTLHVKYVRNIVIISIFRAIL